MWWCWCCRDDLFGLFARCLYYWIIFSSKHLVRGRRCLSHRGSQGGWSWDPLSVTYQFHRLNSQLLIVPIKPLITLKLKFSFLFPSTQFAWGRPPIFSELVFSLFLLLPLLFVSCAVSCVSMLFLSVACWHVVNSINLQHLVFRQAQPKASNWSLALVHHCI